MLFNSAVFLILFFFLYIIYWQLGRKERQYLIIAGSLIFYGWYSIPFLLLFLALIVINYRISMSLVEKKSKSLLWTAIGIDTGLLIIFKYFYLLAETFGSLVGSPYIANLEQNWIQDYDFHVDLPIAISFYTFQIIAFVVDAYRGTIKEYVEPRKFYLFILFFPQFVAGPIMRSTDFIPQIDHPEATKDRILGGALLIAQGVVKKVLMADRLGSLMNDVWVRPSHYDATVLLIALPVFVTQVYLDFSGYTDMARGLAKSLGYEIPENFRGPFLAKSMQELWHRWHITLSTWLRDYIYIPLGGSRQGELRTMLNLLATMAIGGLWHGASWTMLYWGIYLGFILSIERYLRVKKIRLMPQSAPFQVIRTLFVFALFSGSSLFFASPNMDNVYEFVSTIVTFKRGYPLPGAETVIGLSIIAYLLNVIQYYPGLLKDPIRKRTGLQFAILPVATFFVGYLIALYGDISGMFIYFQF